MQIVRVFSSRLVIVSCLIVTIVKHNQHTRELISAQMTSHKYNKKDHNETLIDVWP